jgi:hypothetical protein
MGANSIGALHVIMTYTLDGSYSAPDGPSVGGGSMANANACREPASSALGRSTASGVTHAAVLTASTAAAAAAAADALAEAADDEPELRARASNDPTGDPLMLLLVVVVLRLRDVFFRVVDGLDLGESAGDDADCCEDNRRCGAGELFAPGLDLGTARRQMDPDPERERTSSWWWWWSSLRADGVVGLDDDCDGASRFGVKATDDETGLNGGGLSPRSRAQR